MFSGLEVATFQQNLNPNLSQPDHGEALDSITIATVLLTILTSRVLAQIRDPKAFDLRVESGFVDAQ